MNRVSHIRRVPFCFFLDGFKQNSEAFNGFRYVSNISGCIIG